MELFKVHLTKRSFSALLIQFSAILSWLSIFISGISNRYSNIATCCSIAFSFFTAVSIFVGVYFVGKTDMYLYSIYAWSLISPILTISLIFASELWFLIVVSLLAGLYGNFLLSFYRNFSELTMTKERGRVGGSIGFVSILVMLFLTVANLFSDFVGSVVLCSLLSICLFFTQLAQTDRAKLKAKKGLSLETNCWSMREFFLYLMPWLVYNLVNSIPGRYGTSLLIDWFQIPIVVIMILSSVTSCIGALVGGFVADLYGRKTALGLGLTSYGIASAFSGLIFSEIQDILLVFLQFALTGLSWGIFLVLYFLVVWEDLSDVTDSFVPYTGLGFYPLSMGLAQLLPPTTQFPLVNLALVSCVLIFSSNIFIAAAQELLSPEVRKELDVFLYLEKVKKIFRKIPDKLS